MAVALGLRYRVTVSNVPLEERRALNVDNRGWEAVCVRLRQREVAVRCGSQAAVRVARACGGSQSNGVGYICSISLVESVICCTDI